MRISTRGEYGLRAMVELALHHGQGPLPLKTVAERQGISEPYLEQLMGTLRKAGLVNSVRGAQGGYELAVPPERLKVGDILRALEGPIVPWECLDQQSGAVCLFTDGCATRVLWKRLQEAVDRVIDSVMLSDLVEEQKQLQVEGGALLFDI
ncbi:MAG: Rrf2 family transcriptional regulator [Limnochordales bacterium]|nr:Rrf2 family transcriptional regulator [Limnochordales bacterium]